MKVLILGASGLIGHKLFQQLSKKFDVYATLRQPQSHYQNYSIFNRDNVINNVDAIDFNNLTKIFLDIKPNVIINCIGITKRKDEIKIKYKQLQ